MRVLTSVAMVLLFFLSVSVHGQQADTVKDAQTDTILKVEMHLSAFGVESDDFPSIDVTIDFSKDTSICGKWYFNPAYPGSSYTLSKEEQQRVLKLFMQMNFDSLKTEFTTGKTDQATSTSVIFTTHGKYTITDYGLVGDAPLQEIYDIVYKF